MTHALQAKIDASPHLAQLHQNLHASKTPAPVTIVGLERHLTEIAALPIPRHLSKDALIHHISQKLLEQKNMFALSWAQLYFQDTPASTSFETLGALWSDMAELTLAKAFDAALTAHGIINADTGQPDNSGVFILGLGKLGGRDLNYSSDVDLICFFNPERVTHRSMHGLAYSFHNVLRTFTQILSPPFSPEFVWRVDWRLRPNAGSSYLCHSTEFAEDFYFFKSQPWHRLALIKARPIAGDIKCADSFIDKITPYIWRRNLDFTMVDELAQLKHRINREHPTLKLEREAGLTALDQFEGFDVKLGRGGIREIEFIANAYQLIWGGRYPDLQTPNTLQVLTALAAHNILNNDEADTLREGYVFLRRLENAIQMLDNAHTHKIPDVPANLERIAIMTGNDTLPELTARLLDVRHYVHRAFTQHISDDTAHAATSTHPHTPPPPPPQNWLDSLNKPAQLALSQWLEGFSKYRFKVRNQDNTENLAQELIAAAVASAIDPSEAVLKIDHFLKHIKLSDQYIDLLSRNALLVKDIFIPLVSLPPAAKLLEQSPQITDILLTQEFQAKNATENTELPKTSAPTISTLDFEHALNTLRRNVNEGLYAAYLRFVKADETLSDSHKRLTSLAEQTLVDALNIVAKELGDRTPPLCVLGQGKLGMKCMSPLSDLDLVFIFDDDTPSERANQYVTRLRTALTMPMQEGIAYELDMRLRPSGRSGPAAVKATAFNEYQQNKAKNWEHISLVPARVVAGDIDLTNAVNSTIQTTLDQGRDLAQLSMDTQKMWARLAKERIKRPESVWDTKLAEGGLLQAEFLTNAAILEALSRGKIEYSSDYRTLVAHLSKSNTDFTDIPATLELYWTMLHCERLLYASAQTAQNVPPPFFEPFLIHTKTASWPDLEKRIHDARNMVSELTIKYLKTPDTDARTLDDWTEQATIWVK